MLKSIGRTNPCTSHLPSPSAPLKTEGLERFGSYHHVFIFLKALKRVLQKLPTKKNKPCPLLLYHPYDYGIIPNLSLIKELKTL